MRVVGRLTCEASEALCRLMGSSGARFAKAWSGLVGLEASLTAPKRCLPSDSKDSQPDIMRFPA